VVKRVEANVSGRERDPVAGGTRALTRDRYQAAVIVLCGLVTQKNSRFFNKSVKSV
jgi:hypothetical protein